jgi:hypothetical protein
MHFIGAVYTVCILIDTAIPISALPDSCSLLPDYSGPFMAHSVSVKPFLHMAPTLHGSCSPLTNTGIGPIIITALTKAVSPPALAAAVVLLCCSAVSFAAVLPMARLAPHTTVCLPIGDAVVDSASRAATQDMNGRT